MHIDYCSVAISSAHLDALVVADSVNGVSRDGHWWSNRLGGFGLATVLLFADRGLHLKNHTSLRFENTPMRDTHLLRSQKLTTGVLLVRDSAGHTVSLWRNISSS